MRTIKNSNRAGRQRSGRLRRAAAVAAVCAGVLGGTSGVASAQTSAASQYANPTAATSAAAATLREIGYASFGAGDRRVQSLVRQALAEAGIAYRAYETTDQRLNDFLDSALGKSLGSGPLAIGTGVGTNLTSTTAKTAPIFGALFGPRVVATPLSAAIVSRGSGIPNSEGRFIEGFAKGVASANKPTVYVERTDDPTSFISEFRKIDGVTVVPDIDTAAGRARLVSLISGGSGVTSGGASTSAKDLKGLKATKSAAIVAGDSSDGSNAGPIVLLVVLAGGLLFVVGGVFRHRATR